MSGPGTRPPEQEGGEVRANYLVVDMAAIDRAGRAPLGARVPLAVTMLVMVTVTMLVVALTAPGALASSPHPSPPVVFPSNHRMAAVDFLTLATIPDPTSFSRLAADGVNTVSFDVWWAVPSTSSNLIAPVAGATISDTTLETLTEDAEASGLRVTLTPKFFVGASNEWRGDYHPSDPHAFFLSYRRMVDHYASLAQATSMAAYFVGSEMDGVAADTAEWRALIASVRGIYRGPLSYVTNWDDVGIVQFWKALNLISLSAYYPTSNLARPNLAQLEQGWHRYVAPGQRTVNDWVNLMTVLANQWHRPIAFAEAGYMASTYAAQAPCCDDYYQSDPQLQALAYQALLATFRVQPWWAGVGWWAWNDDVAHRSPEGKPAEAYINAGLVEEPSPAQSSKPNKPAASSSSSKASAAASSRPGSGRPGAPGQAVSSGASRSAAGPNASGGATASLGPQQAILAAMTRSDPALGHLGPALARRLEVVVPPIPASEWLTAAGLHEPPFSLWQWLHRPHPAASAADALALAVTFLVLMAARGRRSTAAR